MGAMLRAIDRMNIDRNKVAVVSGIGCSSRTPAYLDFNTLHTTHGRALAFATGLKLARPDMLVIVVMGDGDALGIGGNHFIHAGRRNIDLKVIVYNNNIYGMTGGQVSPTTPFEKIATTARYGNKENAFDICELSVAMGAVYVARSTVFHVKPLEDYIYKSFNKKGFTVVEAITQCPTTYGRLNKTKDPAEMMRMQKEYFIPLAAYNKLSEEEKAKKKPMGEFINIEKPEFVTEYQKLIDELKK
jgi:2-oxoglutarate ferredoxin oxidoreductase subunit beta